MQGQRMKVLKRVVDSDMNRRLCVERSDCEWVQIEHAAYRSFSDKTNVCDVMVLKLKLAADVVDRVDKGDRVAFAAEWEGMAHVYATMKTVVAAAAAMMTKMDANQNCS